MQKFLNLSPKDSKDLDIIIFQNATNLLLDSNVIASQNKSFSTATSLLILSSEEVIKATLVLLHSEGINVYKLKEAKQFFTDHKVRHNVAQLIEMGSGLKEFLKIWNNRKPSNIVKTVFDLLGAAKPALNSFKRIDKLLIFNDLKNNGLYVDYQDEIKDPKVIVTESEYIEVKEIVERIFDFYSDLKEMFTTKPETLEQKQKIKKVREGLKFFIEDALEDFSFKELNSLKNKR